jgi:hypothetical protein
METEKETTENKDLSSIADAQNETPMQKFLNWFLKTGLSLVLLGHYVLVGLVFKTDPHTIYYQDARFGAIIAITFHFSKEMFSLIQMLGKTISIKQNV